VKAAYLAYWTVLDRLGAAPNPDDPELSATITRCISAMREAVHHLQQRHPQTRLVLVGIFDNSNIGDAARAPRAPVALRNITTALDRYDNALRAMATRAASICFVSSQQRCSAINPYSPNDTVWPRVASPARLPRCILRYFTLSGINGITKSF
jgi:hypothetical protein